MSDLCLAVQSISMDELWNATFFTKRIGLPNLGLDPSRDCNHVRDEELRYIFGERKQGSGYDYVNARSKRVKDRVVELYPVIFQLAGMPESPYVPESFARAVVSEVCHHTLMNWAKYAEDRWSKGKKVQTGEPLVFYRGDDRRFTYFEKIDRRLEEQIQEAENQWRNSAAEHGKLVEGLKSLSSVDRLQGNDPKRAMLEIELECLRESLGVTELRYRKRIAVKCKMDESTDDLLKKWYCEEIECDLKQMAELQKKVTELHNELLHLDPELEQAVLQEQRLELVQQEERAVLDELKAYHKKLVDRSTIPLLRAPSPHLESYDEDDQGTTIHISKCALCHQGFPVKDAIIAPCNCAYHPWCASMHCWISPKCATASCCCVFPTPWLKSFGYFDIGDPIQAEVAEGSGDQSRKRSRHLNSDIGGYNYIKKEKSSTPARRKSKS